MEEVGYDAHCKKGHKEDLHKPLCEHRKKSQKRKF